MCTRVARDELAEMQAELIVGVGGDAVELIHRDQPVVERLDPEPVHGEADGRMGADQHLVLAFEEARDRIDLVAIVRAGRVTEVPFRGNGPIGPKAEFGQLLVVETPPNRLFRERR